MKIGTNFYTMTFYDNLIYSELISSWDDRVVNDFVNDIKRIGYELYKEKAWAIITDCSQWRLFTPEAEQCFIRSLSALLTNLTHNAIVTGSRNIEIKQWIGQRMFANGVSFETRFFVSTQDAEIWLASLGYDRTFPVKESESLS